MPARARTLLAVSLAIAGLLGMAATASATDIQYSPGGSVTATGALSFTAGSISGACTSASLVTDLPTTPIPETAGATLGTVSGGTVSGCTNTTGVPLTVTLLLPWPLQLVFKLSARNVLYDATPAAILVGDAFGLIRCLYQGRLGVLFAGDGTGITLLAMPVPLWRDLGGILPCPDGIVPSGRLTFTTPQTVSEI
jgi:hypothetical protein